VHKALRDRTNPAGRTIHNVEINESPLVGGMVQRRQVPRNLATLVYGP
jgi:hypothetical protein